MSKYNLSARTAIEPLIINAMFFTSNPRRSSPRQDKRSILPKTRIAVEMWLWTSPLGAPVSVSADSVTHVRDVQGHGIPQVTKHLEMIHINLVQNFQFIIG